MKEQDEMTIKLRGSLPVGEWSLLDDSNDVVLLGEDGVSVGAHSSVLASTSDMLTRVLGPHVQCPHHGDIHVSVPGVSGHLLRSLVSMLHHGQVSMEQGARQQFVDLLECLGMDSVITALDMNAQTEFDGEEGDYSMENNDFVIKHESNNEEENEEHEGGYLREKKLHKISTEPNNEKSLEDETGRFTEQDEIIRMLMEEKITDSDEEEEEEERPLQTIVRKDGLVYQRRSKLKKLSSECPVCKKEFKNRKTYVAHYRMQHTDAGKPKSLLCPDCGIRVSGKSGLAGHRRYKHNWKGGPKKWPCDKCDYVAIGNLGNLKTHQQRIHEGFKIYCDQCERTFVKKADLAVHVRVEHEGIKFKCKECDFEGKQQSHVNSHYRKVHLNIKHPCEKCSKVFQGRGALKEHMLKVHLIDISKFKCSKKDF